MSPRRRTLVVASTTLVVLAGAPVFADTTVELLRVLAVLERIHGTIRNIRGVTEDIRTKLTRVWPDRALKPILTYLEPVQSIQREVAQLSCGWRFSPRMERIRLGVYGGVGFCKREWEGVFGQAPASWSKDLEDYYDWSAVRRMNAVGNHVKQNAKWAEEAAWLTRETVKGTNNPGADLGPEGRPGYAQRLAALGTAQLGNLLVENGKLQAYELELAQEKLNEKRRRMRLEEGFAFGSYRLLTFQVVPPEGTAAADLLPEGLR